MSCPMKDADGTQLELSGQELEQSGSKEGHASPQRRLSVPPRPSRE